uniref:Neurogenic locus notch homolog protein 1-like n=1 Tax=Saccoglossus kowalevskii TaxID=10224 RepID=A0ABM0MR20_SACKO|nr:PREDICTED: neurogenic locus notch homolog protein 1-like [Saccoglossus kowalevskii]
MEVFYIVCAVLFLSTYTLAQVPAPRDVVARAHTLNKVSLTWRDPDLPEGAMTPPSGRIYRISYRATHPWQTSFQEVEADEAWASVNNLSPFTRYEFLVTIEQDGRRGSQSEATAVTTVVIGARGAPTSTASINKVEEYGGVTGVNVLVRWTTKDDPDNEYTGHIIFYTHSEAPEFKESYMSWAIKRMDGKDNRAVIEELNPESMYGFLVQPFNANGGGPVSMIYWYTTPKRDAGGIVRPGGLGIGEKATNRKCPPGVRQVKCAVDPCENTQCSHYRCEPNYCGRCSAVYFDVFGNEAQCESQATLHGCAPNVQLSQCEVDPCEESTCPKYPNALCRANYCGGCFADFYDIYGSKIEDCRLGGDTELDEYYGCPPDVPVVACKLDPCLVSTCPRYPRARCKFTFCGECKAEFYNNDGAIVDCGNTDTGAECPPGVPVVSCIINPCQDARCPADRTAVCKENYCGGCIAEFFDTSGNKVNCEVEEKPGTCPVVQDSSEAVGLCVELCISDSDCAGSDKCCSNGCGHVCRPPKKVEKEGSCPATDVAYGFIGYCAEYCSLDDDCPGEQKCCSNGCGHVCIPPAEEPNVKEKPGNCPASTSVLGGICAEMCNIDQDCPDDQKCCSNGCGHDCMSPVTTGLCESVRDLCLGGRCINTASGGYTCICPAGTQLSRERTSCEEIRQPESEPPCHTELRAVPYPYPLGIFLPSCRDDGYYEKHQCHTSTGYCWCSSKEGVEVDGTRVRGEAKCDKDGECPARKPGEFGACVEACTYDHDCPGTSKCCSNGCGLSCVEIETETEELDQPPCHAELRAIQQPYPPGTFLPSCREDGYYEKHQCYTSTGYCWCASKDGTEVDGTRVRGSANCDKPGTCPAVQSGLVGTCVEECSYDYDCADSKKCCYNGCGHTCVAIESEPQRDETPCYSEVRSIPYPYAPGVLVPRCRGDGYYEKEQCHASTGQCWCVNVNGEEADGTRVSGRATCDKAGTCPAPQPGTVATCDEACSYDYDCAHNEKCCSNGCGNTCIVVQTEKLGTCPSVAPGSVGTCVDYCQSDFDCADNDKCCSNGCGHSCVAMQDNTNPGGRGGYQLSDEPPCMVELRDTEINSTPGMFKPRCNEAGFYTNEQCWESNNICWCVTKMGNEVDGTRVRGSADCDKPGSCPAVTDDTVGTCVEECSYDHDCFDDQKCCSNGCGHTCVTIPEPKSEEDNRESSNEPCNDDLREAYNVPGSFLPRCTADGFYEKEQCWHETRECWCVNRFGTEVSGTRKEGRANCDKSGECPAVEDNGLVCDDECSYDYDCSEDSKCCSNGCGRACMVMPQVEARPVEKPGECPVVADGVVGTCAEYCSNDGDCGGDHKCCSNGCGHTCVAPAKPRPVEKPGECPVVADGVVGTCAEYCSNDGDCGGDHKCCSNGCGHTCVAPAKPRPVEKPGECPVVADGVVGTCAEYCSNDGDCGGDHKCCSNGCGRTCVAPARVRPVEKKGECPVVEEGTFGICSDYCSNDGDCGGDHKCCSNGCGHTCVAPERDEPEQKPGICPAAPEAIAGFCADFCDSDMACFGDEKCCSTGCGHVCLAPVKEKEGTCPAVRPGVAGVCTEFCSTDNDCNGKFKCCSNGCGHVCVPPFSLGGGIGGGVDKSEPPCHKELRVVESRGKLLGAFKPRCTDEGYYEKKQCWGSTGHCWCTNKHGEEVDGTRTRGSLDCDKLGTCPAVSNDAVGICVESCSYDHDCPGNDKCCSNGCGHVCRPADLEKEGTCPVIQSGSGGICVQECAHDYECEGDNKCCSNGCGNVCSQIQDDTPLEPPCRADVLKAYADYTEETFIPYCDDDGYYLSEQCWHTSGECWCTDRYGNELTGSRTNGRANCT